MSTHHSASSAWETAHWHDTKVPTILAVEATMIALATVATVARLISKRITKVPLTADDNTLIAGLIVAYGLVITAVAGRAGCRYGLGRHSFAVDRESMEKYSKILFAYTVIYPACITLIKLSILLLYSRLFVIRTFRHVVFIVEIFVVALGVASCFATFFRCTLVSNAWRAPWDQLVAGVCIDRGKLYNATASLNIIADFALLILPMPVVWHLQMSRRQKLALTGVFALGSVASIASIVRLYALIRIDGPPDLTWDTVNVIIWYVLLNGVIAQATSTLIMLMPDICKVITNNVVSFSAMTRPSMQHSDKTLVGTTQWPDGLRVNHESEVLSRAGAPRQTMTSAP
ncbi:MAG: hypothetical protein M1816_006228 [Peltula sp. TS41687]|nr:MAG: hypothetical protein M1816_006228 [Peltula sp. TS41687]